MGEKTVVELIEKLVEASGRERSSISRQATDASLEVVELKDVNFSDLLLNSVSVDAASASLYVNGNYIGIAAVSVVSPSGLLAYPHTASGSQYRHPFISSLRRLETGIPGVTDRYIELGVPYEEDPYVDFSILESDVRLSLELYGLSEALSTRARYVLIDGPLVPPARPHLKPGYWSDELSLLVGRRIQYIRRALGEERTVVGFVKRVRAGIPGVEFYVEGRPVAVGPVVTRDPLDVCYFYIVTERSRYSQILGRAEIPCATVEEVGLAGLVKLLSMLYSSCSSLALPVPHGIYAADRASKNLVKKIAELVELAARSRGVVTVLPGDYVSG